MMKGIVRTPVGHDCFWAKAQALRSASAAYPSLLDPRESASEPLAPTWAPQRSS
jgi:hypothetical protein